MPNEPQALAIRPPDAVSEDDYFTLCAALSQNARGRAFLSEHARRSRNADNAMLLAAIGRIEARLKAEASAAQRLRDDLRMLVSAIRLARPEIDAANPAARATKLARLLDLFERRIDAMSEGASAAPAGESISAARMMPLEPEPNRARLFVLPMPDEPDVTAPAEAPVSSPAVEIIAPQTEDPAPEPALAEPPPLVAPEPAPIAAPRSDPLAAIMALSEDERLALFT